MNRILGHLFLITVLLLTTVASVAAADVSVWISHKYDAQLGDTIQIRLMMQSQLPLGGIDFKIKYDESILGFVEAVQDTGLNNWESFYSAHNPDSHTVGMASIADINNGPVHPKPDDFYPLGSAVRYTFVVTASWPAGSARTPISFYWGDCGDNAVSNTAGDTLMILRRLFDCDAGLIWDETDDATFPEGLRPDNIGVPDSCLEGTTGILMIVDMTEGAVANYYICGDADGNGMVNISDPVFILSYIFGSGPISDPMEAGDVDCNRIYNISDAVYLLSYIFGGGPEPCASCP